MGRLVYKRLILLVPLLLGISFICYGLVNLSPSDPAEVILRVNAITPTPEAISEMRKELELDKPFMTRYFLWLEGIVQGDFGISYETKTPVLTEIQRALPVTLILAGSSFLLIVFLGLSLGILCAVFEGSLLDKILRGFVFTAMAMPSFWLGLLFMWFFALKLDLVPISGAEDFRGYILPTLTLSCSFAATYIRIMRNTLINTKENLYILHAKVRGLKKSLVLKHQIINALQPFIIAVGMSIPRLIAGTVIVESIFSLPGLGRLCVHAIFSRDYPMIQAYILFMAVAFILFNLLADVLVQWIDPRLRRQA
jgi:nickel transport system permease protein